MQDESTLVHREHASTRSFDEVVSAFEAAVGHAEKGGYFEAVKASSGAKDFERRMHELEGSSGFMCFQILDHGAWMALAGLKARARQYIIGNPLIASTMIQHDVGVGLNVPVRVLIYEDPHNGACRVAYDVPSSLMARLKNARVNTAAKLLDEKLNTLAEMVTGVAA